MWLAIHDGAITLGVSLHEDMTKAYISQRQDAAAGTQTSEPLVILEIAKSGFWCKLPLLPLLWHANAVDEN